MCFLSSLQISRSPWLSLPSSIIPQVFSEKEGRVRIEEHKELSSFVIESAERSDEDMYTIKVTNPVGEDVAFLNIKVVGKLVDQWEGRGPSFCPAFLHL